MEQLGNFLVQLTSSTVGAAAGAAATMGAGPVVGAAATAAATKVTSALVSRFLGAQKVQLQSLEGLNYVLSGRLSQIETGLFQLTGDIQRAQSQMLQLTAEIRRAQSSLSQVAGGIERLQGQLSQVKGEVRRLEAGLHIQLDEPWKTAHLYLEHAAEPQLRKATRDDYLIRARDKLFEAHSIANNDVSRALIAQRLGAISLMLNERPSSRKWLLAAYPTSTRLIKDSAIEVQKLFEVEWNAATVQRIVTYMEVSQLEELAQLAERAQGMQGVQAMVNYTLGRLSQEKLGRLSQEKPAVSSQELFWARFIAASVEDRAAMTNAGKLKDRTLSELPQIEALWRLHVMAHDLDHLRASCIKLGADRPAVPQHTLFVDLLPLRRPVVALMGVFS